MFHNNKELRISLILLSMATAILTLIAVTISIPAGAFVLLLGLIAIMVHLGTEYYRYRKLQKLSSDLDKLLISMVVATLNRMRLIRSSLLLWNIISPPDGNQGHARS